MLVIMLIWLGAGLYCLSLFPIENIIIKSVIVFIWCAVYYIPFLYLKVMWIARSIKYCYVYCKGERYNGTLLKVEEKRMKIGWNDSIVLHYNYEHNGKVVNAIYKVNCVCTDFSILGLRYVYGKYVIPDPTIIPVVVYKRKSIVIHNDCGMYDVAHYKGGLRFGNYF